MIVKTRQPLPARSRGVLRLPRGGVRVTRHSPASALACYIAYYWMVSWDLCGRQPHLQETLPHPNVYLVLEENRLQISGVSTCKFTRLLQGQGFAIGVKFKPGGFRPFLNSPVSSLTNRVVAASEVFSPAGDELEEVLISASGENERVDAFEDFFLHRAPAPDTNVQLADRLVGEILRQPRIRTVEDLAAQTGIGKRSLQRLFREYVGVAPKWVIQRYRLHDLVDRLEAGVQPNWSDLALELGYFDQAHLIHEFKAITGYTPANYRERNQHEA